MRRWTDSTPPDPRPETGTPTPLEHLADALGSIERADAGLSTLAESIDVARHPDGSPLGELRAAAVVVRGDVLSDALATLRTARELDADAARRLFVERETLRGRAEWES